MVEDLAVTLESSIVGPCSHDFLVGTFGFIVDCSTGAESFKVSFVCRVK